MDEKGLHSPALAVPESPTPCAAAGFASTANAAKPTSPHKGVDGIGTACRNAKINELIVRHGSVGDSAPAELGPNHGVGIHRSDAARPVVLP